MKEATNSFASLSPSLLARKGGARPAMRPQLAPLTEMPSAVPMASNLDDLGWNDMGDNDETFADESEPATSADIVSLNDRAIARDARNPVHQQVGELSAKLNQVAAKTVDAAKPRKAAKSSSNEKRAAFTLRLDAERHLKLRLACTMKDSSAQQIVTDALDALLEKMPEIGELASKLKRT